MDMQAASSCARFSDRVFRLLERVEHRCAVTRAEKGLVSWIRYESDYRQGLMEPRASRRRPDRAFDDAPNAWIVTTYIDGELASALRIHVAVNEKDALPSLRTFSDVVAPFLRSGSIIVDPTRPVAQSQISGRYPELPYVALRPAWLAAVHFGADFLLATVVEHRQTFFRQALGYEPWCGPRECPDFNRKVVCMGLNVPSLRAGIENRYPFFRSTEPERVALFGSRAAQGKPVRLKLKGEASLSSVKVAISRGC